MHCWRNAKKLSMRKLACARRKKLLEKNKNLSWHKKFRFQQILSFTRSSLSFNLMRNIDKESIIKKYLTYKVSYKVELTISLFTSVNSSVIQFIKRNLTIYLAFMCYNALFTFRVSPNCTYAYTYICLLFINLRRCKMISPQSSISMAIER